MKTFLLVLVGFMFTSSANWLNDFDQAKQLAKQDHKTILLNFSGSDWCGPCIKMTKDVFEKPAFAEFADQELVLVRADFPRHKKNLLDAEQTAHNEKLAEQYNPKGKFPLTLLIDGEGHIVSEWDGYQNVTAAEFINQVKAKLHAK